MALASHQQLGVGRVLHLSRLGLATAKTNVSSSFVRNAGNRMLPTKMCLVYSGFTSTQQLEVTNS